MQVCGAAEAVGAKTEKGFYQSMLRLRVGCSSGMNSKGKTTTVSWTHDDAWKDRPQRERERE